MRITFLGTGAAWPIPRIGCACAQCASGDPRDVRSRSAALVEATPGGPSLLVDAGPDIYRQLARLGKARAERIEALAVTHVHPDHYLGLVDLSAVAGRRLPLYHLEDNRRSLEAAFHYLFPRSFELRTMTHGAPFEAAGVRATPFDAHHFNEFSTSGLLLEADGKRAVYASDFKRTDHDLRDLDLLVLDGSSIEKDIFGHLSITNGAALARSLAARRTVFTHVGHVKKSRAEIEALGFDVAWDGLEIDV